MLGGELRSIGKSPYKTACGAVGEREGGAVYYVQISSAGLMAASGYYHMAPDQLTRFRDAVADERTGPGVAAIVAALERDGLTTSAIDELKTAPAATRKTIPGWPCFVARASWPVDHGPWRSGSTPRRPAGASSRCGEPPTG